MRDFYLTILNSADNPCSRTVAQEIANGDLESFAARFINGIVHQARCQTGDDRPIGETTALRIAQELFAFYEAISGVKREMDYGKIKAMLRLDTLSPHDDGDFPRPLQ